MFGGYQTVPYMLTLSIYAIDAHRYFVGTSHRLTTFSEGLRQSFGYEHVYELNKTFFIGSMHGY